ncbi:MAG: hypothetical protein QG656_768, partial [Candidatus Hydrogenedentes bacterium]|nr:hypothetical protein [Candidatus Hydrogenedentota bacterium]
MRILTIFLTLLGAAFPCLAEKALLESEIPEPGLTYGAPSDFVLPKTVLFSAGPDQIAADAEEWAKRGVRAFFLDNVAREWCSDIWAKDGKPWTIGASDETFQMTVKANEVCRRIGSETFLKVSFDHFFEWFNDLAWEQTDHNFHQFAIFARETGCTGMALDIEYIADQYSFDWNGYSYDGYTRADLVAKIRERMTKVMGILYDEFPDMVFLTFPEQGLCLGAHIHAAWVEEAARRNAPGGIHYCTEFTYRNPNIRYMFGHAASCTELIARLLSPQAKAYWTEHCTIAEGIWPFGFNYEQVYDPGMTLDAFRQGYAASLMASPKYNWIYSHNCYETLVGRGLDKYKGEANLQDYLDVIQAREIVTTPKYAALAQDLRAMRIRDYAPDLGLMPVVSFAGPDDVPKVRVMPVALCNPAEIAPTWTAALEYFNGADLNVRAQFQTQTDWLLVGPFPNAGDFEGHDAVYGPETSIDLNAEYDGATGKVRWIEHHQEGRRASVDLTKVYEPKEH